MAGKTPELSRNGHELAPLNNRATASDNPRKPGVTIVLQGPRGSIISRGSQMANDGGDGENAAWSGKLQFFLTIIGYSVGLGNIWRFPYLCQKNGGGAFLIPFAIMLICEGIPLFLIELGIGQKMRLGSLGVWNTIHPWLGGIGISSCIVTFFVALYYNVIITWCFYYVFNSFRNPLPWDKCPQFNNITVPECAKSSATKYFWYRVTLDASPAIDQPGEPKWWIVLCLLLSWIVVFFIVMKGIQSSGKVVYFTSLFPYVVLTIFLIKGLSLDGAADGLKHMLKPKVKMLLEPSTWLDAATQVFYSFGLAFGSLIAFGSYNTPKNNCVRDVILVSICNAFTAIYASIVIFAILGFKALKSFEACQEANPYKNCSLEDELNTAAQGTGLAFVVFTEAIVNLPFPPIWAILFFLMLLSLGIGSQIGIIEGMLCTVFDIEILKRVSKQYITATVCTICFFIGIIFTTGAGEYWLSMFDSFAGTIGLVVVALMEMISVIYVYGHEKFTKDIHEMTGVKPGLYWQITWRFLAPAIMIVILLFSVGSMIIEHPKYTAWIAEKGVTQQTDYPGWVLGIAAAMVLIGVLPIPIVFLLRRYQILKMDINIHEGSIRRIDTTVSTKEMITDVDLDDDDEEAFQNGPLSIYDESSSSENDDIKNIKSLKSKKSSQSHRTPTSAQNVSRSFRMNLNED